jgi:hypothetical protein
MVGRVQKLLTKLFKKENRQAITPEFKWAEKIAKATVKAVTNEILQESTEADFGNLDRGENYKPAVLESTIIRIRNEWLEE